ncbi:tripartite tricarboxylate transporter TctB family protein [Paracoccus nototheniae]|uniref:Tripartite tricarboxylate transporter TctB family protein n=1 Tax=Paracoccus nototheniae TaxID=2489002 RepID=A0ABW4DUR3_9RHOB|nr:tripartite tricarboxylate transporter TctB family protein [Paracoccus nototheniae]
MTMNKRVDLGAGLVVAALGIAVAAYTIAHYPLGSLRRMGPGMFPMGLGVAIAVLGASIALTALPGQPASLDPPHDGDRFETRTAILALAGVVGFALLVRPMGLVPAVLVVVGISAFADRQNRARSVAVLAVALAALAAVMFRFALGLPFPLFAWSWG